MPRRTATFLLIVYCVIPSIASADLEFRVADGNGRSFQDKIDASNVDADHTTAQTRKIDLSTGSVTSIGSLFNGVSAATVVMSSVTAIPKPSMLPALAVLAIVVVLRVKLKHYWDTTRQP